MASIPENNDETSGHTKTLNLNPFSFENGTRKSAFLPYKKTNTVLTNLQRGNTEANVSNTEICLTFHEKAGQGEITVDQIRQERNVDILDKNQFTPLHWSCFYGQISAAVLLIENGAEVNKLAPDLITPLLLAAAGGHHEIARVLLHNGADPNHLDIAGNSAIMYAAAGNHPHTCNEILTFKPSLTRMNEDGETAYSLAVKNNSNLGEHLIC